LDTIATVRPAGTGCAASSAAASTSSPRACVVITPACSNSASRLASGTAGRITEWPAAARPASTVSTGMAAPTRRAVRANFRGLPNDSIYSTASRVTPSCSHHSSMSLLETSSLSPADANEEIPTPSRDS